MKANAISQDFPFPVKHEEMSPFSHKKPIPKTRLTVANYYNNESPSMFRLDSMIENKNGYNNPFLDEVIKVDRSEEFKKMDFNRQQINLIDKIKTRREFSQNPKILRYIRSDFDIAMQEKRERNLKERNKGEEQKKFTLTEGDDNEKKKQMYDETLTKLHNISPKIGYRLKKHLELDNLTSISNGKLISDYDKENYKTLTCSLEPKKSGYLRNIHDYDISEADKFDESKVFHFNVKPQVEYNLVKDKIETLQSPVIRHKKWDAFYENFFMLMGAERGFRKKGGLFTEFANRNIGVIEMNKRNDKEKKELKLSNNLIQSANIKRTQTNGSTKSKIKDTGSNTSKNSKYKIMRMKTELTSNNNATTCTERAKKVIEEKNLFKLKDVYERTSPNRSKESLPLNRY